MKTDPRFPKLHIVDHPLVQHKLTIMRQKETSTNVFRQLLHEITVLMGYELTRDLPLTERRIETPISPMRAPTLAGKKQVIVPVLRAGLGMSDGLLELMPSARVGHIGMYATRTSGRSNTWCGCRTSRPTLHHLRPDARHGLLGRARRRRSEKARRPWNLHPVPCARPRPPKASPSCRNSIRTWKSTSPPLTRSSTRTLTSFRAWATRATGSSARSSRVTSKSRRFLSPACGLFEQPRRLKAIERKTTRGRKILSPFCLGFPDRF